MSKNNTALGLVVLLVASLTTGCSNNSSNQELSASQKSKIEHMNEMMFKTIERKLVEISENDEQSKVISKKLTDVLCALSDEDYVILDNQAQSSVYISVGLRCIEHKNEEIKKNLVLAMEKSSDSINRSTWESHR